MRRLHKAETLLEEIQNDENNEILEDIFPQEMLDILEIQEGHDRLSPDPNGRMTSFYGITENGVKTVSNLKNYAKVDIPEYIEKAWDVLGNKNNYKTQEGRNNCKLLAGKVNQYYQWFQNIMLDGYTDNKFSNLPATTRYAVLLKYNNQSMYKMENSLLVEAIRLNNRGLIAKSMYSSSKKDASGNEILDDAGMKKFFPFASADDDSFKNYFATKLSMANSIPTPEEYRQIERKSRENGTGRVPKDDWNMVDKTLDSIISEIFKNNNYWKLPDGFRYQNEEFSKGRSTDEEITSINKHDKKTNTSSAIPVNEIGQEMKDKTKAAEDLRNKTYPSFLEDDKTNGVINTITNYFANTIKNLFTNNNEVNDAKRNANNNM